MVSGQGLGDRGEGTQAIVGADSISAHRSVFKAIVGANLVFALGRHLFLPLLFYASIAIKSSSIILSIGTFFIILPFANRMPSPMPPAIP